MAKLTVRERNKRNMTRISRAKHKLENDIVLARYSGKTQAEVEAMQAKVKELEDRFNDISEPCPGEAHSNPFIDNCGLCAPFWERRPKSA